MCMCVCVVTEENTYQLGCRYSLASSNKNEVRRRYSDLKKSQSGFLKQRNKHMEVRPFDQSIRNGHHTGGWCHRAYLFPNVLCYLEASDIVQWNDGDKEQITPAILGVRHTDSARPPRCGCRKLGLPLCPEQHRKPLRIFIQVLPPPGYSLAE